MMEIVCELRHTSVNGHETAVMTPTLKDCSIVITNLTSVLAADDMAYNIVSFY